MSTMRQERDIHDRFPSGALGAFRDSLSRVILALYGAVPNSPNSPLQFPLVVRPGIADLGDLLYCRNVLTGAHSMPTPSDRLVGVELPGGWCVVEKLTRAPNATGGGFSVGYIAESREGTRAFLKAMDYAEAFSTPEKLSENVGLIAQRINFERALLSFCKAHGLRRVVTAIDTGTYRCDSQDPLSAVEYLLFELAEGDVRSHIETIHKMELPWVFQGLHAIASALDQLHRSGIAHQDLKPSNVLVFDQVVAKLADLGRSVWKGQASPHDQLDIAGDLTYAPPELLYGSVATEWNRRRLACDAYLLGSMVVFFFTQSCMTTILFAKMPSQLHHKEWKGTFDEILPYLTDAFSRSLEHIAADVPVSIKADVMRVVGELCHPDPGVRGKTKTLTIKANQYSLQPYISFFDLMSKKCSTRGL